MAANIIEPMQYSGCAETCVAWPAGGLAAAHGCLLPRLLWHDSKAGSCLEAPDPDEEYPLQDPEFELGQEAPLDKQDHYLVCI